MKHFDAIIIGTGRAVLDGKLIIPINQKLPLSEAAEAQAAAEKGGVGKILLVA